jgi:WD40 repeat protein
MPAPAKPTGVVPLAGHGVDESVRCIVSLPGGDRVATVSDGGNVRVFAVATGALEHGSNAHEGKIGCLAALGRDIIVSGNWARGVRRLSETEGHTGRNYRSTWRRRKVRIFRVSQSVQTRSTYAMENTGSTDHLTMTVSSY